jgi:hypothetical protein
MKVCWFGKGIGKGDRSRRFGGLGWELEKGTGHEGLLAWEGNWKRGQVTKVCWFGRELEKGTGHEGLLAWGGNWKRGQVTKVCWLGEGIGKGDRSWDVIKKVG